MKTFLKKCPSCGKDHRSFKCAMACFLPYKHIFEWLKASNQLVSPAIFAQFETMRRYLFNRFGCSE